jgi:hypothetical protein
MSVRESCFDGRLATRVTHWLAAGVIALMASGAATAQTRPALVKDVDSPASQPFAFSSNAASFGDFALTLNVPMLTVPTGKRAVVEHVSCIDFLTTGNNFVRMEIQFVTGGVSRRHQFVHTLVGGSLISGIDIWSFSQPVRLYADAGTAIQMSALRRSSSGSGGVECDISGHYVDAL